MITIATPFWQSNATSQSFSRMYTEEWVEKLYRGFARNLTVPFNFVVFTDRVRQYGEPIAQELLTNPVPTYADCLEPYRLGEPMILCGLDTVVTGNCDELARYCLEADTIALPRDPYKLERACNGVALVPRGNAHVWNDFDGMGGSQADMVWMRKQPHVFIDDIFPGAVQSYKGTVRDAGLGDCRICYFHGREKPHEIKDLWISDHWR